MPLEFRAQSGRVAIFDADNPSAFTSPKSHIQDIRFHSDLDYIKIISTRNYTLSLPAINNAPGSPTKTLLRTQSYTLGSHGQSGIPLIFATTVVNTRNVAFTGSVPVHNIPATSGGVQDFFARWLAIGATATSIVAYEYAVQDGVLGADFGWTSRPAQSLPITVYITDVLL